MLANAIMRLPDDFITVKIGDKEYIIESVGHTKTHNIEDAVTHLCLNVRDAGDGCVLR